jgi:hypothetical protein
MAIGGEVGGAAADAAMHPERMRAASTDGYIERLRDPVSRRKDGRAEAKGEGRLRPGSF